MPDRFARLEESLAGVSPASARILRDVIPRMEQLLLPGELSRWSEYCSDLAQSREWDGLAAFLRLSPFLVQEIGVAALWQWAEVGAGLAQAGTGVARDFFGSGRSFLDSGRCDGFEGWVNGGRFFLTGETRSPSLAAEYFRRSRPLLASLSEPSFELWKELAQKLSRHKTALCRSFFGTFEQLLEAAGEAGLKTALQLAAGLAEGSPELALECLERRVIGLRGWNGDEVAAACEIAQQVLSVNVGDVRSFLDWMTAQHPDGSGVERRQTLHWAGAIARTNPQSVMVFLGHVAEVSRGLDTAGLQAWVEMGLDIARANAHAGEAFFALESATAQERLRGLRSEVLLVEDRPVLELYSEAVAGHRVKIKSTEEAPQGLQMVGRDLPSSDGKTLFLPSRVHDLETAAENFVVYKIAILRHVSFLQGDTFEFAIDECTRRVPRTRRLFTAPESRQPVDSDAAFSRFFAAFSEPNLARRLFTMIEDSRIDAKLTREYRGIRRDLVRLMAHSLQQRPDLAGMPPRRAALEGLLQYTLGARKLEALPSELGQLVERLWEQAQPVHEPGATVYTTAAATLDCYLSLRQIGEPLPLEDLPSGLLDRTPAQQAAEADGPKPAEGKLEIGTSQAPALQEEAPNDLDPVPYRGAFDPELMQKRLALEELSGELSQLRRGIDPQTLQQLLEMGRIEITSIQDGNRPATGGLSLTDLGVDEAQESSSRSQEVEAKIEALGEELSLEALALDSPSGSFLYDEWDHQIQDYRRRWCRLTETLLGRADTAALEERLHHDSQLLARVRRQFELLKPEVLRRIKRLVDGEEVDLDAAIESWSDRRAGLSPSEKLYMRRSKKERDVAAVFLLDMSASTDSEVSDESALVVGRRNETTDLPSTGIPSGRFADDWDLPLPPPARPPCRRVIDVEKEALVLMAEALETLGDRYAIYGFSGYGRDQVDFFIAKEFHDSYDEGILARIAAMQPHRSTRMGPAIRHAIYKLGRQEASIKTLLVLSDGYPQDFDYGKDRTSREHGIRDTMMSVREAQLQGVHTFFVTVDPAGHDYLREICPDQQYLVIEDITALPNELPKVYRSLTM